MHPNYDEMLQATQGSYLLVGLMAAGLVLFALVDPDIRGAIKRFLLRT